MMLGILLFSFHYFIHYLMFGILILITSISILKQSQNKNKEAELDEDCDEYVDAIEAFIVCHTSRKKGMSVTTRQAAVSSCYAPMLPLFSIQ